MHLRVILKVVGIMLTLFSVAMLPPVGVSLYYGDGGHGAFLISFAVTLGTGLACGLAAIGERRDLRVREGFVVVVAFWTVLAVFGAIPFALVDTHTLSVTDAFFETMSGLTTTGATVLTGIDDLPHSVRLYRQQLQWLGGMGIIVLAVAIMPMLGVGGMQLYRAELPGPLKDTKLTPRITETAKALWYIYLGLTVACAVAYWLAGMDPFDAVGHSFSTVAIGGFSTHDENIAWFDSPAVDTVAIVFMLLAGMNFALHFAAWRSRSLRAYLRDPEATTYLRILAVLCIVAFVSLTLYGVYDDHDMRLRQAVFQVVSIATTTGFHTGGYHWWPSFLPILLLLAAFVGGCGGSTAGGIKVMRILLLYKQGVREFRRLVHPSGTFPIRMGGRPVQDPVIHAVWGFFSLYVVSYVLLSLALVATGLDPVTGFSAVAACLNNLGPGLGEVAANYAVVSDPGKWILSFAMLLGRLELFTLLVLFTRTFWRS